jgi:hypothetical protein
VADLRRLVQAELTRQEQGGSPGTESTLVPPTPPGEADPELGSALAALRAEVAAATAPPALDRGGGRLQEVRAAVEELRRELYALVDRGALHPARPEPEQLRWGDGPHPRAMDLDSPEDLEELAGRLYGRLRGRLRQELVVDRERSGRLAGLP